MTPPLSFAMLTLPCHSLVFSFCLNQWGVKEYHGLVNIWPMEVCHLLFHAFWHSLFEDMPCYECFWWYHAMLHYSCCCNTLKSFSSDDTISINILVIHVVNMLPKCWQNVKMLWIVEKSCNFATFWPTQIQNVPIKPVLFWDPWTDLSLQRWKYFIKLPKNLLEV